MVPVHIPYMWYFCGDYILRNHEKAGSAIYAQFYFSRMCSTPRCETSWRMFFAFFIFANANYM